MLDATLSTSTRKAHMTTLTIDNERPDVAVQTPTEDHSPPFKGALFWIAIAFSIFQIVTAAFSPLSSSIVRAMHVGFLLLVTFALLPPFKVKTVGWLVGAVAFLIGTYHWIFEADLVQRAGELTDMDMWWASSPSCWCSRARGA